MKRIFTLIALIGMMAAGAAAQSTALVSLSHEGNLTFFEGYDSLEQALEAAQSGDVLYLSRGIYAVNSPEIIINKKVRLVGDGYDTFINSHVQFVSDGEAWTYTDAEPALEGLRISQVNNASKDSGFAKMIVIRACKIGELGLRSDSESYVLDRCYIGKMQNVWYGLSIEVGVYARNCLIEFFNNGLSGSKIVFENCNIKQLEQFYGNAYSCIIANVSNSGENSYFYKCWLGLDGDNMSSDPRADQCDFTTMSAGQLFDKSYNYHCNTGVLGSDDTPAGVLGGQFPYSEAPSLPTVNVANSSVSYDSGNNQLNVNITVKE